MSRVTVEIVPYGVEEDKQTIGVMEIANIRDVENLGFGNRICEYRVRSWTKSAVLYPGRQQVVEDDEHPTVRVLHNRKDGFWRLLKKSAQKLTQTLDNF